MKVLPNSRSEPFTIFSHVLGSCVLDFYRAFLLDSRPILLVKRLAQRSISVLYFKITLNLFIIF